MKKDNTRTSIKKLRIRLMAARPEERAALEAQLVKEYRNLATLTPVKVKRSFAGRTVETAAFRETRG